MNKLFIKQIVSRILQCLLIIASITIFCYSFTIYISTSKQAKSFSDIYINNKYIKIIDNYDDDGNEGFMNFMSKNDSLSKLKSLYEDIINNIGTRYLEIDKQNIYYIGKYFNNIDFVAEKDQSSVNQNFKKNSISTYITPLNAMQISSNSSNFLDLRNKIAVGEYFNDANYNFKDNQNNIVDIVLGNNYKDTYKIGDEIKGLFLNKEFTFKVKGFLFKNTIIPINRTTYNLDNFIIMPLFNYYSETDLKENDSFQKILYSIKTSSYIRYFSNEDYKSTIKLMDNLFKKNNLNYICIPNDLQSFNKNSVKSAIKTSRMILLFSLIIMIITSFTIIFMTIKSIDKNLKYYSIHLINGAKISKIKFKIHRLLAIEWIIALVISIYCDYNYFKDTVYFLYFLQYLNIEIIILILLIIFIIIILEIYMKKINICLAIRRKD